MSPREPRRPLEDMIGELVGAVSLPGRDPTTGLHASSVEFSLPVEMRVSGGPGGFTVHADMPATRTQTVFDMPVGRLNMRLTTLVTGQTP
jgi:hypothetical protein